MDATLKLELYLILIFSIHKYKLCLYYMDPVSLIAIISASSALVVAVLTHIKYSSCCGFKLRTTEGNEPITPSLTTPLIQSQPIDANLKLSKDDFLPQKKSYTFPSDIPKSPPIFNKNNYL